MIGIQQTLQRLGDQTSRNLEQAYELHPTVRLGEEAITEHNLLALATTHPRGIQIQAFGKKEEAKNGADWEWEIIGRLYEWKIRVQAKRVSKDGFVRNLNYQNKFGSQLDQLIASHDTYPIVCFYSATRHRTRLTAEESLELGCLFADARKVRGRLNSICNGPKTKFSTYENLCYPWHHLKKIPNAAARKRSITKGKLKVDQRSGHQDLITTSGSPDDVIGLQLLDEAVLYESPQLQKQTRFEKLEQGVIGRITINLTDPDRHSSW